MAETPRDPSAACVDVFALRRAVARWLAVRAAHVAESWGISEHIVPKDRQAAMFTQLSADAAHSDLLVRLLGGEEPLPFEEWKERHAH